MWHRTTPSRRLTSRVEVSENAWVYWGCEGREDVSRIRNLSMGGLFIETPNLRATGAVAELDFLVQEGQIRAEAVVRHAKAETGLGLRFIAVRENDRSKLAALLSRLRSLSRSHKLIDQQ